MVHWTCLCRNDSCEAGLAVLLSASLIAAHTPPTSLATTATLDLQTFLR